MKRKVSKSLIKAVEKLTEAGLSNELIVESLNISDSTLLRIKNSGYDYEKYNYIVKNKDKKVKEKVQEVEPEVEPELPEYVEVDDKEFLQLILIELRKANQNLDELKDLLSKRRIF